MCELSLELIVVDSRDEPKHIWRSSSVINKIQLLSSVLRHAFEVIHAN